jgi:hypothetical protein
VNADATAVTLTLPAATFTLTTAELDDAIQWLCALRVGMSPPIPGDITKAAHVYNADVSTYCVPKFNDGEVFRIALRSQCFGWISYNFKPEARLALAATLTGADRAPPPPGVKIN